MGLLDLIFPDQCLICKKEGQYICLNCLSKVPTPNSICPICFKPSLTKKIHLRCLNNQNLDGLISLWRYKGIIKKAILALKYKFATKISRELANLSLKRIPNLKSVILVPIPLFGYRQNWRGFNQSEEIGKMIAGGKKWQFVPDLLIKTKHTVSQVGLSKEKRGQNVQNIFSFNSKYRSLVRKNQKIVLFDDVWTTGSTLKEAGKVLKREGFKKV